jgi:hypothetical protein
MFILNIFADYLERTFSPNGPIFYSTKTRDERRYGVDGEIPRRPIYGGEITQLYMRPTPVYYGKY